MFKVQQNRYLWVHLVGLAAVPLLLDICLAGLASAGSALAFKAQFWLVALIGIVPSAWMQIQKPFYIYSLPPLAVKPGSLSEDERRCLTVLKSWQIKALAGLTAGFLLWLLVQLYERLPQVSPVMEPGVGLVSAITAFFFACLFLQISVSVVRSLLIGRETLKRVKPFEESAIATNFLIPGIRINKIFPVTALTEAPTIENAQPEVETTQAELTEFEEEIVEADDEAQTDESIEDAEPTDELSEPPSAETTERPDVVEDLPQEPPLIIPEMIESDEADVESDR